MQCHHCCVTLLSTDAPGWDLESVSQAGVPLARLVEQCSLLGSAEHPDVALVLNRGQGFIQKQQALYKDGPGFRTDERCFEGVQRMATRFLRAAGWIF